MNRQLTTGFFMAALALAAQAQDTYLNDRATNTSDVIGTARYVGMGGAMGALGADLSVISNNPAGIGLMRKGQVAFTLGGQIQDARPADGDPRGAFSFDQLGFVVPFGKSDDADRLNFAFNYQKKVNYNQGFLASQRLGGLSQADMFAWIANGTFQEDSQGFYFGSRFYDNLYKAQMFQEYVNGRGDFYFRNTERGETGNYHRRSWGSLQGFEFNLSGSLQDRVFWGLTVGVDHMAYHHEADYEEVSQNPDMSYILFQEQELSGYGFNVKAGAIVRPVEDSPLRIGLAVETPTWYELDHQAWVGISFMDGDRYTQPSYIDPDYLEYNLYAPWKLRASVGSTQGGILAWDIEYEYALNNYTKMGYPDGSDGWQESGMRMEKDREMNRMTRNIMRGVHNVRAGVELKPVSKVAFRAGYNFYSKPFRSTARLDQTCNSPAFDWATSTEYVNLGATHLLTLGLGYQGRHFFADLAYKYRHQRGDFFAFDDNFTSYSASFIGENGALRDATLRPAEVNLDRHNIAVTLGYRF